MKLENKIKINEIKTYQDNINEKNSHNKDYNSIIKTSHAKYKYTKVTFDNYNIIEKLYLFLDNSE